ncbi:MAG: hypothetical protein ABW090_05370 [Sedimenticola sp.]
MKGRPRGRYFLGVVLLGYLALAFVSPNQAWLALVHGLNLLAMLLPIFCLVILLTALLTYWLKPETIARHLGHESGARGWGIALASGVLSHGPMYAWYPLLQSLRQQGMGNGLITVFLYARSIKLPLLPLMIDYFGLLFVVVFTFYVLVGALMQGKLIVWLKI